MRISDLPQFVMYEFYDVAKKIMQDLGIDGRIGYRYETAEIYIEFPVGHVKMILTSDLNYELDEYPKEARGVVFDLVAELRRRQPIKKELEKAFLHLIPTTPDLYNWRLVDSGKRNALRFMGDLFLENGSQAYNVELNVLFLNSHTSGFIQVGRVFTKKRKDARNSPTFWKDKVIEAVFTKRKLHRLKNQFNMIVSRRDRSIKKTRWMKNNPKEISLYSGAILDKYYEEVIYDDE